MKKYLFLVLLVATHPVAAIVNMEGLHLGEPAAGLSGHVKLVLNGNTGNSKTVNSSVGGKLQLHHDRLTHFLLGDYSYGKSGDTANIDKGFFHARSIQQWQTHWATEAFAQVQYNAFARLDYRGLLGGGLRYSPARDPKRLAFFFGLGAFHAEERLSAASGTTDALSKQSLRLNSYVVLKFRIDDRTQLLSTSYWQPDTADMGDYQLLETLSLKIALGQHLGLGLALNISRDSRPPQSVQATDTSYTTQIEYRF